MHTPELGNHLQQSNLSRFPIAGERLIGSRSRLKCPPGFRGRLFTQIFSSFYKVYSSCYVGFLHQQKSTFLIPSYSILFHLTTSYSSYFGGKKGISRNKTSFFLLMAMARGNMICR